MNGMYLNWVKLTKKGPEAELHHGDIVSFLGPPHHGKILDCVILNVDYVFNASTIEYLEQIFSSI